ncbi:MAG: beta-N-acetylhexosaminidase [Propioniciclava sp.]
MIAVLPRPERMVVRAGEFELTRDARIAVAEPLEAAALQVQQWLQAPTGFPLTIVAAKRARAGDLVIDHDPDLGDEAYQLDVGRTRVRIAASTRRGALWGAQVLRQLLPPQIYRRALADACWRVPAVNIEDEPHFAWRGAMLDVARTFRTVAEVCRFVELLSMHRLNVLHLHLTDDQGWRLQIERHPRLTEVGGWRPESQVGGDPDRLDGRPHGGFYTHGDIREIVAFAAARGVDVVPEIDLPGHVRAAVAAYPALGVDGQPASVWTGWGISPVVLCPEESTITFFEEVFDEVMDLFPSSVIGVGGDECLKEQWRDSPRAQERIGELGLADEEELQSWFIGRIAEHLAGRGRRVFGWDEILEGGAPPNAVIASWRGMVGAVAAARAGHDVIACPDDRVYLDYRQSDADTEPIGVGIPLSLADVHAFEPVPAELTAEEATHVVGGQANIWTEHIDTVRALDYMAFPRLCAVAEALWVRGKRDFTEFSGRMATHLRRLDAAGVEYRPESGPLPWQQRPGIVGRPQTPEERAALVAELTANIG